MGVGCVGWNSSSFLQTYKLARKQTSFLPNKTTLTAIVIAQKKTSKIILKENVEYLGKKGELLDVKAGYFHNFLLPMGKAQIVTTLSYQVKEDAQQLALIFETVGSFKVKRKGGKGKQIFGSVTAQDLVDIIKAQL